jgi:hypothetical protein
MIWLGVRERVLAVQGAWSRTYPLLSPSRPQVPEPVLTPGEITEVEAQYGVALPAEYRSFLAEVGAGGAGPRMLTSLRRVEGRWGWVEKEDERNPWILDPSRPFTETEKWAGQQVATLQAAGHEPGPRDGETDYYQDYRRAFGGDRGEEAWHVERGRGAILISDDGCGTSNWLIAVGPCRGELRYRECEINPPFEPVVDARGNRHTFRTWYLEWLERREAGTVASAR